jgi:hypothetical protein
MIEMAGFRPAFLLPDGVGTLLDSLLLGRWPVPEQLAATNLGLGAAVDFTTWSNDW